MPRCSWWICGLYSNGMVVGRISKTSEGKAFLTTGELQASDPGLEVHIGSNQNIEDGDYGLAVVSCANTIVNGAYTNNGAGLSSDDIDLSKLELIAFFSFMDPDESKKDPMAPETAIKHFNALFKKFVEKDSDGQKKELLYAYGGQPSSSSYAKA